MGLQVGSDIAKSLVRREAASSIVRSADKTFEQTVKAATSKSYESTLSLSGQAAQAAPVIKGPATVAENSMVHFDESRPEIQAFAQQLGWDKPNSRISLQLPNPTLKDPATGSALIYTTDHWKTTRVSPLQYLIDNQKGFVLRDVAPGTDIEYAVHAFVGRSHDNFYSLDAKADTWVSDYGRNFHAPSEPIPSVRA